MRTLYERIDLLRSKPKHVKETWVIGLSLGATALIFLGWAANLSFSLSQINAANLFSVSDKTVSQSFSRAGGEFSEAWATFEYGVEDFNAKLEELETANTPEAPTGSVEPSVDDNMPSE